MAKIKKKRPGNGPFKMRCFSRSHSLQPRKSSCRIYMHNGIIVIIVNQDTLRKVSHVSISLVIVITLVLLTSCDDMGLSKLWHHVWSALWLSSTMAPPPYFVYICLSAIPFYILATLIVIGIYFYTAEWRPLAFEELSIFLAMSNSVKLICWLC